MPLATVARRADVMGLPAPLGPVYQAGALSGNSLAMVVGLYTLKLADQGVYGRVNASAQEISTIVPDAFNTASIMHRLQHTRSLFFAMSGEAATSLGMYNCDQTRAQEV